MEEKFDVRWSKFYQYNPENKSIFPQSGAVFEIWSIGKDNEKPLFRKFIGETENLLHQLENFYEGNPVNEGFQEFLINYQSLIRYYIVLKESSRKEIVKTLYKKIQDDNNYVFNSDLATDTPSNSKVIVNEISSFL